MERELYVNSPLVSIVVITYNSQKYVIETLESAKNQTYKNIELIITDDGSTDETIVLCQEWLKENAMYFVDVILLTSNKNTGIPTNCNRGVLASKGEWIKLIAGDDILMNICIETYINYISGKNDVEILFSNVLPFSSSAPLENDEINMFCCNVDEFNKSASEQYLSLIFGNNFVLAPSSFIKKKVFVKVDYFDEKIVLIEDYPFWIKVTRMGIKLNFIDQKTVLYRVDNHFCKRPVKYFKALYLVYEKYRFSEILKHNKFLAYRLKFFYWGLSRKNRLTRVVILCLTSNLLFKKMKFFLV
jgi:glycosyltransferase involved in cell wall biosynthesis